MNINEHTTPQKLEKYSFFWSIVRMFIAALSLLIGGYPIVWKLFPISGMYRPILTLLMLCWVISGVAAGYLLYRWYKNNMMIFGGKNITDRVAFLILAMTGINLGVTGLIRQNIGMQIFHNSGIWTLAGIVYIITAVYLLNRWKNFGRKMF